ncbi:MAG: hypothetical protein KHW49_07250 [Eubacterium sp.]|nr:hypothetical protein [Eubacterium sp.]
MAAGMIEQSIISKLLDGGLYVIIEFVFEISVNNKNYESVARKFTWIIEYLRSYPCKIIPF